MSLIEKINKLGAKEYINCFLVTKKVRDGYLFQTVDYNEFDINSPITKEKLNLIKEYFPSLILTPNKQGVLLSIKKFSLKDIEDDAKLGNILGFPCSSLTEIMKNMNENPDLESRTIDIIVNIAFEDNEQNNTFEDNEQNIINYSLNIISFRCLNYNKYKKKVKDLVSKIKKVFNENPSMKEIIKDVKLQVNIEYSEYNLIKILSNYNKTLSEQQILELNNYLYNIGFDIDFQLSIQDNIDYNNPIHRGILIGLLTYSKYPTIKPFTPLQNYGEEKSTEINEITKKWGDFILESIHLIPKTNYRIFKKKTRKRKTLKI